VDHDAHEEFTRFLQESGTRLHRTALLLTGDRHQAEDLLQTTYARLFASWRKVRRAGNPVGYARAALTNGFISEKRLRRSTEVPTDQPYDTGVPTRDRSPDDRLDLLAALATLPRLDRAVLVLRYWEDRSVAETAVELGLTDLAVRSRASRALARMRAELAPVPVPSPSSEEHS
jgi:RNA polymerase sigma-70 factor (sigma-E family)